MTDRENVIHVAEGDIPDGTQFVIVDLDRENERVQVEFSLNGKVFRTWVPASRFEEMVKN